MEQIEKTILHNAPTSFLLGIFFLVVGFNGEDIASFASRPRYESSWFTSGGLINTFTYVPLIIGSFFIIIALSRCLFLSFKQTQSIK